MQEERLVSRHLACPCCGFSGYLRPYQKRFDINGRTVDIEVCSFCTSLVDRTNLTDAAADQENALVLQEKGSQSFYSIDKTDKEISSEIDACEGIARFLLDHARPPIERETALDFGAGLGFLAAGAARHFKRVYALELNMASLEYMQPKLGAENLRAINSLRAAPFFIDAVFMWHTLEHIPNAWQVCGSIVERMAPGGAFFLQVPMYHDKHIVDAHFTFFNEYSLSVFADRIGLVAENAWHDKDNQFLTFLARKPL